MIRELPQDYEPFQNLRVCSNLLLGGGYILAVSDQPVLLVGKGVLPLVWCSVPADERFTDWVWVIERNTPTREILKVASRELHEVKVLMQGKTIVRVVKKSADEAEIKQLDLRDIGFDVHGDEAGLNVGGSVLRRNTFANVRSMIGIPPNRAQTRI